MKRYWIFLVIFTLRVTTLSAQNTYQYQNGVEIPLDDFPWFVDGFRIQFGAFALEASARAFADSLRVTLRQSIHLRFYDGLYSVQVGSFRDSSRAVQYRDSKYKLAKYQNLLVVRDRIPTEVNRFIDTTRVRGFRIQVQAVSDRDQALELGRKLDFDNPEVRAYVIQQDTLYKVQLGDFTSRGETEAYLERLNEVNDWEAWIIPAYVYKNPPISPLERPVSDPFDFKD